MSDRKSEFFWKWKFDKVYSGVLKFYLTKIHLAHRMRHNVRQNDNIVDYTNC